jgi:hypothetical protein
MTDDMVAARRQIIRRHARLTHEGGNPKFCHAPAAELERRRKAGMKSPATPVIYPDLDAAAAAESELRALDGVRQWPYLCPRSRNGHAHLRHERNQPGAPRPARRTAEEGATETPGDHEAEA